MQSPSNAYMKKTNKIDQYRELKYCNYKFRGNGCVVLNCIFFVLFACVGAPEKELQEDDVKDTATDTEVVEEEPIEEGRTSNTFCSAGGYVEGSTISGSFCFGAVDVSAAPQATSNSFTWQPGPFTTVSP